MGIEWNQEKARSNLEKHSISFEEAFSSLLDPDAKEGYYYAQRI